jgi:hypothetical protein
MTTFVLVHGAWHGGWCYKRVARLRQALKSWRFRNVLLLVRSEGLREI